MAIAKIVSSASVIAAVAMRVADAAEVVAQSIAGESRDLLSVKHTGREELGTTGRNGMVDSLVCTRLVCFAVTLVVLLVVNCRMSAFFVPLPKRPVRMCCENPWPRDNFRHPWSHRVRAQKKISRVLLLSTGGR